MAATIIPVPNRKIKDHTGKKFGRLSVLGFCGMDGKNAVFVCQCDCGNEKLAKGYDLARGNTQSCGCLQAERTSGSAVAIHTTHGMSKSPEYKIWDAMRRRCTSPADAAYADYGGRGIEVCTRWLHSFEAFYADMGPRPSPDHSLDRDDNNGNYEPGNVVWATRGKQSRNRRSSIMVEYEGQQMVLKDAAILAGVKPETAYKRYRMGWSIERVLTA